jgi:DNA-binding MarR family transcriptional regulator
MKELQNIGGQEQKTEGTATEMSGERIQRAQNILKSLRVILRTMRAHSRLIEKKSGMRSTHLWMLWEIGNAPGIKVTKLADLLSMHQTTCSNMLDRLQQKDLIRRDRGGPDQRVVHLYLTEKGNRLMTDAPQPARGVIIDALQHLPDEALTDMEKSLGKLIESLVITEKDAALRPLEL